MSRKRTKEKHTGLIDSLAAVLFPFQESEEEQESFTDVGRVRVGDWLERLLRANEVELRVALTAILTAARGDEKGECWSIRHYLDERGVFNDDIGSNVRLIEEACKYALKSSARLRAGRADVSSGVHANRLDEGK